MNRVERAEVNARIFALSTGRGNRLLGFIAMKLASEGAVTAEAVTEYLDEIEPLVEQQRNGHERDGASSQTSQDISVRFSSP